MLMNYTVIPILGKILKDRGMTQVELSKLTGIPQGTISKFDRNKQHQDVHLVTIAKVLGLSIEDLFYIEEQFEFQDLPYVADSTQPYIPQINLPEQETYDKSLADNSDPNELVGQYLNKHKKTQD